MFGLFLVVGLFGRTLWLIVTDKKFRAMALGAGVVLFAGTSFYSFVEHWSLLDALYFSVVSLTTVGYGDLTPKTDAGKAFTIVYLLSGVTLLLGFINAAAELRTEHSPAPLRSLDQARASDEEAPGQQP